MVKTRFNLSILSLLVPFFLFAQDNQKLDSILKVYESQPDGIEKVKTLQELFYAELYNTPVKAKDYARKGVALSKKIAYTEGEGVANYHLGSYYQIIVKVDSARYYYEKSSEFWKNIGDKERLASSISSIGILEQMNGNYEQALGMFDEAILAYKEVGNLSHMANTIWSKAATYIEKANYNLALKESLKALKIHDSLNNKPWRIADDLRQLGQIEDNLKNYSNAISYFQRAIKVYDSIGDNIYLGHSYQDLGYTYYHLKEFEKALKYHNQSLEIAQEFKLVDMEANALANLGTVYSQLGQYSKAITFLEEGLEKSKIQNGIISYTSTLRDLGDSWQKQGNSQRSLFYLDQAIVIADSIAAKSELKEALSVRAGVYEMQGNLISSIADLKRYIVLNDSIFNTTKSQQIEELRTIFETEKKEQQIALQEKEITVLEQKAEISTLQKMLLGGLLLLSLIGFYGIRQKLKRNKLEKEKVDAELAFKKKELTTHALHLAKKNEVLESVKLKAKAIKQKEDPTAYQELIKTINFDQQDDKNWESFTQYFEQVHKDFAGNVKTRYPDVTKNELRFMALIKMNMSSKEIATILNVSPDGIKKARQRLRKKLNLTPQDSLENTVLSI